ncbi:hypothetical protein RhiirA4_483748 [Rhizophagus irregularis]|uniref:Uncharacterized protein n=1 Tax=Rhizophagus irregularis TaxID=588596 RepID=A0A2I1HN03_9GLOM|nr:hypothetical protein RhiirA4_483748 [Rhizophagus irregularis]
MTKNFAYRKILDVLGLISLTPTTIKGIKVICTTYKSEAQAEEICKRKISNNNEVKFTKMKVINNQQANNLNGYKIKIWDVSLNVDKQMLELYLKNLGLIKNLKFNVKNLYYEMNFSSNLAKEERNLRFKYGLKIANLAKGTYIANLKDIMIQDGYNNALGKKFSFINKGNDIY